MPRSERSNLLIMSLFLLVVALVVNAFWFIPVNDYISTHGGWGDIPMAGLPWISSMLLIAFAAFFVLVAERTNR